jgi:hypothetical protein
MGEVPQVPRRPGNGAALLVCAALRDRASCVVRDAGGSVVALLADVGPDWDDRPVLRRPALAAAVVAVVVGSQATVGTQPLLRPRLVRREAWGAAP